MGEGTCNTVDPTKFTLLWRLYNTQILSRLQKQPFTKQYVTSLLASTQHYSRVKQLVLFVFCLSLCLSMGYDVSRMDTPNWPRKAKSNIVELKA